MTSALSCDQLCPITADRSPINATCQCPSMPPVSAHQCHISVPIGAHLSCLSVPTISVSATYQCRL
ncbi:unnamed protein product [Staurois parvus]|uniref:Uncharacterized protein n=1 Tax=Staurois parvus TaxID=386267 RepID=A0ABN9GRP4_9NEOB|nr:unnamed protein product [Staurois parvus]